MVELHQVLCVGQEGWNCSALWLLMTVVFFAAMIIRKQCDEGVLAGTPYNPISAIIGGIGMVALLTIIGVGMKWAFIAGLIGVIIGGFIIGRFWDTTGE